MDSKRKTKQNSGEYTTNLYRYSGEMSQTFTTDNEIFNLLADGTQHPLSTEANLCQVSYEIQDESNKELFLNLTTATALSYQVNLDLGMDMTP